MFFRKFRVSRIQNRQVTFKIKGRKCCSGWNCDAMVNFEITYFLLFGIGASWTIFKATIFTRAALINQLEGFAMIHIAQIKQYIAEIVFLIYFSFPPCRRGRIAGNIFRKICIDFYLVVTFWIVYIDVVYRLKALKNTNDLAYGILKLLLFYCIYAASTKAIVWRWKTLLLVRRGITLLQSNLSYVILSLRSLRI